MENILRSFFDTADAAELAVFDRELSHIAETCTADNTDAILSAALEKAGMKPKPSKTKKHKRRRLFILIAAAVVILSALSFTVFFDKLDVYFGISDKGSPFVGIFNERQTSASNDDLTLTVDGAFIDDSQARYMVSLTAKNREGRKIIDTIERVYGLSKTHVGYNEELYMKYYGDIDPYALRCEGSEFVEGFIYTQGIPEKVNWSAGPVNLFNYNTASAFYFEVEIYLDPQSSIDLTKPMKITEYLSGLSVEVDLTPNLETVRLVSDDPNAYETATISPLFIRIYSPEDDPYAAAKVKTNTPTVYSDDDPVVIFVHKKDGTVLEVPHAETISKPYGGVEGADAYAHMPEITMLDDIDHVTILDIDYRLER